MKIPGWIKWILGIGAAVGALFAGKWAVKTISAILSPDPIKDGDNFAAIPDNPDVILVSKKETPQIQMEVALPPGIKSGKVVAVKIVSTGQVSVQVLP